MTFAEELKNSVEHLELLKHPFYQDWMEGKLTLGQLKHYAEQYTPFVDAFPRIVSGIHNLCDDAETRRELFMNLLDEEGLDAKDSHPRLWRNFGAGLGTTSDTQEVQYGPKAIALKNTLLELSRSSFEEGLCALYSYEHQIPQVSEAKIQGLVERYGITSPETLKFFAVHQKADVYHSDACAKMIESLPVESRPKALRAAQVASEALWDFLTEVHEA